MNWYLAKIIFRIVCGEGDHTPQFDEQIRLVQADSNEQAFTKAYAMGRQEADCFMNQQQKMVEWKFIDVPELYKLSEMIDGAELYSRIQEADNAELYIDLVHQRAAFIRQNYSHSCLQLL